MLLQNIHSPDDLKKIPKSSLKSLAKEIRTKIIDVVGKNGGHLASNLGVVELTIALHRVFDSPRDAIVWDVSHQSYPHKLLTGRYEDFNSIRQKNGISGFTRITESDHDYFDAGHASSSISSALGLLMAWKLQGRNDKVVAVIGDGALTGGMAFEALNHAGQLSRNLIVIVNDNQMSIGPNTGAVSRYLSYLTMTRSYQGFRNRVDHMIDKIPVFNRVFGKVIYRFKRSVKGLLLTNNLFSDFGFEYFGPLDGHNVRQLEDIFRRVKKIQRPVVVHVVTKKGKGYSPAENKPENFHGVGPFNTSDGVVEKFDSLSFTEAFSSRMLALGKENPKVMAVTAAMAKGTGLDAFSRHYRDRFFDVGIAEEHAVTFAGGLAAGGAVPVVAIYSTFIQRSVDQIIEDLALQRRHAVMVFDRAGAVPGDGETHQGIFDIALLKPVPNLTVMSVASARDLEICLDWAVNKAVGPVAIRWPKLSCPSETVSFSEPVYVGRGLLVKSEEFAPSLNLELRKANVLLVCTGGMYDECLTAARYLLLKGIFVDIFTLRFIKPLDEKYFLDTASVYGSVVFVEDGIKIGGISEYLQGLIFRSKETCNVDSDILAFPDKFLSNGSRHDVLHEAGLSAEHIALTVEKFA